MKKRKWTDEELAEAVKTSRSIRQTLLRIGLCGRGGGSYYRMIYHIERLGISTAHFSGSGWLKGGHAEWREVPVDEYLKRDWRKISSVVLKRKLIQSGLRENKCAICGSPAFWNGSKLTLQLDHINGKRSDNRIENLRIVCPNCHSQTPSFAGRRPKTSRPPRIRKLTPSEIDPRWRNRPREHLRKVARPSREELQVLLASMPVVRIGKKYGVSDNAVRKWAKCYGLTVGRVAKSGETHLPQEQTGH